MRAVGKILSLLCCSAGLVACGTNSPSTTVAAATPAISLSATAPLTLDQGDTTNLTATVQNDANASGVKWTLSCTIANCGTLANQTSSAVTYTAPPPPRSSGTGA